MPRPEAIEAIHLATAAALTLATAESLTGGRVCASLVEVPGASAVVRGAVVAYSGEVKHRALGVPEHVLAQAGVVSESVALAMADGVRDALGAEVAVATTGAAGPEPHDGAEPGTVCIAVTGNGGRQAFTVRIDGDRDEVVEGALTHALRALGMRLQVLTERR